MFYNEGGKNPPYAHILTLKTHFPCNGNWLCVLTSAQERLWACDQPQCKKSVRKCFLISVPTHDTVCVCVCVCVCRERRRLNGATHFSNHLPQSKAFVQVIFLSFRTFFSSSFLYPLLRIKWDLRSQKRKSEVSISFSLVTDHIPAICCLRFAYTHYIVMCAPISDPNIYSQRNKHKHWLWPTLAWYTDTYNYYSYWQILQAFSKKSGCYCPTTTHTYTAYIVYVSVNVAFQCQSLLTQY